MTAPLLKGVGLLIVVAMLGACSGKSAPCASDGAGGHLGTDGGSPDVAEVGVDASEDASEVSSDSGDSGDSGDGLSEDLCAAMCAVVLQIDCPDQSPMAACVAACVGGTTKCVAEAKAQFECLVAAGSGALLCDPDFQVVTFRDGYCTEQSQKYAICLLN